MDSGRDFIETWMPVRFDAYGGVDPKLAPYFDAVRDAMAGAEVRLTEPQWTLVEAELDRCFGGLIRKDENNNITSFKQCSAQLKEIPSEFIPYTVKGDDTVNSVALKFNTKPAIIRAANLMGRGTSLTPEQILLVPSPEVTVSP